MEFTIADGILTYYAGCEAPGCSFISDDGNCLILAEANLSFLKVLRDKPVAGTVFDNLSSLVNGFVIVEDRNTGTITLCNDIFGIYPIFMLEEKEHRYFSTSFYRLLPHSTGECNTMAVADILFFNYTLLDRTIIRGITRLRGGSRVEVGKASFSMQLQNNFVLNMGFPESFSRFRPREAGELLAEAVTGETDDSRQRLLTMSGGFDSRVLLAACTNRKLPLNTLTFGQQGSLEQETISPFITRFSTSHTFMELGGDYPGVMPSFLGKATKATPDSPSVQDLVHYSMLRERIEPSWLISGFMGGELIAGQSVGAGVTFTAAAAGLLTSSSAAGCSDALRRYAEASQLIDLSILSPVWDEYIDSLSPYFRQPGGMNILRFMINEKYAKFFGVVNKIFLNHSMLVTPFMTPGYLKYLLTSDRSILLTGMLNISPVRNMRSRMAYARIIAGLCPDMMDTRLDRLYRVKDLALPARVPLAVYRYIMNHLFGSNRKRYVRPHHYDLWYAGPLMEMSVNGNNASWCSPVAVLKGMTEESYHGFSPADKKICASMLSINMAADLFTQRQ